MPGSRPSLCGRRRVAENEIVERARTYLDAWKAKNYGAMTALITPTLTDGAPSKMAGRIREECVDFELEAYLVTRANFEAAAVCEVDVLLTFTDATRPHGCDGYVKPRMVRPQRLIRSGHGISGVWGPWALLNRSQASEPSD